MCFHSASIRIVHDAQIHMVACAEVSNVTRIADTQKNYRDRTMKKSKITALSADEKLTHRNA
jgi:hypothetical protein